MRSWGRAVLLAFVPLACGSHPLQPPVPETGGGEIWIRDVTLISPERAAAVPHVHVLVRAGRITWVGTAQPSGLSPQVKTVDGTGRYLVPGLIDGHVHLAEVPGVNEEQAARMPA